MSYFSQFTNRQATPNRTFTFGASGNWVSPSAGWVTIAVVGAGGSGGTPTYGSDNGKATGGGAGGFAVKTFYTPAGATYVITIGAGGASASGGLNTAAAGASGGITTVNGALCSLTCNSGGGGQQTNGSSALSGGVGGNATGGDVNYTGGRGGNTASNDLNSGGSIATGGGAVSINGTAYNGGDQATSGAITAVATGGGGVGGSGGTVTGGTTFSSGGGTGGPGTSPWPVANYASPTPGGAGSPTTVSVAPFLTFQAPGGYGFYALSNASAHSIFGPGLHGGFGAGGGGVLTAGNAATFGGMSQGFGGGGGYRTATNANSGIIVAGPSIVGGGGGGVGGSSVAANVLYSGFGGNGAVYIGFYGNNT